MSTFWQVRCECGDDFTDRERALAEAAAARLGVKGRWAPNHPPVYLVDLPDTDKALANAVAAELGRVPLTRRVSVAAQPVRQPNHTGHSAHADR